MDTLLMAGLILYGSSPFEKAVKSKTKQLAYVFQVQPKMVLPAEICPFITRHSAAMSSVGGHRPGSHPETILAARGVESRGLG